MLKQLMTAVVACANLTAVPAVFAMDPPVLCPPLSVDTGLGCFCTLQNYSSQSDTFTITLYNGSGGTFPFPNVTAPANGSNDRNIVADADTQHCGCKVTGAGGRTRVSLSIVDLSVGATNVPKAVVACDD